jgi:TMEM175 potassium channel family protein
VVVSAEEQGRGLARILAFSDGVFAIAITLLVLNLKVPELAGSHNLDQRLLHALGHDGGLFIGFVVSFYVVARFWISHHALSLILRRADARFITLNFVFLALIVFVPFPTELLGVYGDTTTAVVLYAATLVATSVLSAVLWSYAYDHGLTDPKTPDPRRDAWMRAGLTTAVFGASIPIAFVSTGAAKTSWVLLAILPFVASRRGSRRVLSRRRRAGPAR